MAAVACSWPLSSVASLKQVGGSGQDGQRVPLLQILLIAYASTSVLDLGRVASCPVLRLLLSGRHNDRRHHRAATGLVFKSDDDDDDGGGGGGGGWVI